MQNILGRISLLSLLCCLAIEPAYSQKHCVAITDSTLGFSLPLKWSYVNRESLWLRTSNAAGLSVSEVERIGMATLDINHEIGDFRRPQEPYESNSYGFSAAKYERVKGLKLYGSFSFKQVDESALGGTDILNPYRGTPYVYADYTSAKWIKQVYRLNALVATNNFWERYYGGLGINYGVATGARQLDPRPLSMSNDLTVTPSIMGQFGRFQLGVNGVVETFKEALDFKYSNSNKQYHFVKMLGLASYKDAVMEDTEERTYKGFAAGAEVQGKYCWLGNAVMLSGGYRSYSETTTDGYSVKQNGGDYSRNRYYGFAAFEKRPSFGKLQIIVGGDFVQHEGSESDQKFVSDDPTNPHYITLFKTVKYKATNNNVYSELNLFGLTNGNVKWMGGLRISMESIDQKYLFTPKSELKLTSLSVGPNFTRQWSFGSLALLPSAAFTYYHVLSSSLSVGNLVTGLSWVADNITYPDFEYLTTNRCKMSVGCKLIRPLRMKGKVYSSFIDFHWDGQTSTDAFSLKRNSSRQWFSISVGLSYL